MFYCGKTFGIAAVFYPRDEISVCKNLYPK